VPVLARRASSDPDDVKALLIAAILHNQSHLRLRAVVANGGGCARERARLARCILDYVGATDVPVGVGTDGAELVVAQPHEYLLPTYASVPDGALRAGEELLIEALTRAPDKSVRVVMTLADFAQGDGRRCAGRPAALGGRRRRLRARQLGQQRV
jgi:hypothetical protein